MNGPGIEPGKLAYEAWWTEMSRHRDAGIYARVWQDMSPIERACWAATEHSARESAQGDLRRIRDAWRQYQNDDINQEEFEGTVGRLVEQPIPESARESAQGEGWVACSERLPEIEVTVIVVCRSRVYPGKLDTVPVAARLDGDGYWIDAETHDLHRVAYWMPLPPPPKP
jgi:hypothetical protein